MNIYSTSDESRHFLIWLSKKKINSFILEAPRCPNSAALYLRKGTLGSIHCLFKAASLATLNKQMPSSFATYDALSLVNHKAKLHLVWLHIVDICSALVNSW